MSTIVPNPYGKTLDLQKGAILSMHDIVADVQDSADSNLSRLVSAMFKKPASIGAIFDHSNEATYQTAFKMYLSGSTYTDLKIDINPGSGLTSTNKFISLAKRMTIESDGVNGLTRLLSDCQTAGITDIDMYIQLVRKHIPAINGGEETQLRNGSGVTTEDAGLLTIDQLGADVKHIEPNAMLTSKTCYWFLSGSVEYGTKDEALFLLYPCANGLDISNTPDSSKNGSIVRIGGLKYNGSEWVLWRDLEEMGTTGCALVTKNFI